MSIVRNALSLLLAACLGATACGSAVPTSTSRSTSRPSPVSSADAAARCQQLADRHVTPCPPSSLPAERIAIHNGTHGAVADGDARAQGEAYLRAHALYVWAVHQEAGDAFLLSDAIVPAETARTNIFRSEIKLFADARAAGGRARIDPLTTTEITLVQVPQALHDLARRDGLEPSPYAWVDNQSGPARGWIETPNGGSRDEVRIGAGQPHPILVFGQVRNDAQLGSIWYAGGEYGCLASAQVRAVCAI
ncbi:MAG TPA: hypothetical protein VOB72_18305 [Candidatus Dormibacteraeota bacterium]|nr:hypothetical protein [Candidatus Dormibacteraeota bacterium]